MSIQFLGMIGHRLASETLAPVGPILDKPYIAAFARAHEEAGFDRILVGYWSDQPDGFLVAAAAGLATSRIGLLLAHRPGFVAPTLAARKLATLEHILDGRLAVHIISGGSDADQRKDGDYLDHDQRYARSDEFIELLKRTWTSTEPFDFHGAYYRVEHAFSAIRPQQKPHIPVYFGGSSEAALKVAGKQADVFMLWGEPLAQAAETISAVREQARSNGREVEFSL
ncbi:LLM class flavin-dependent oxidoreductase, partial [Pseudomonas aeruginosa]|nr:LLM class flavin-dependent oxidoreductase [Pseudomonas aeruginosa]